MWTRNLSTPQTWKNVAFVDYECDGCRIRKTKCEKDGNPNGTITYHFPSGEKYEEVLRAWKADWPSYFEAHPCQIYIENVDNCPVCTEDQ